MSRFFLFLFQVRRTNCFAHDLVPLLIYQAHLLDPQGRLNLFPRQEFRMVFCFQMLCQIAVTVIWHKISNCRYVFPFSVGFRKRVPILESGK